MKSIRFVVVGCGRIGRKHIEKIRLNPNALLVALVDIKPEEQLNVDFGCTPYFNSLESFFQSGIEADVLNIATPNYLHAAHAVAGMNHGLNVVLEKPVALNLVDAQRIQDAEKTTGKTAFVVMQNRYSPLSVWAKDVVDSGILGQIYMVQVNCYWNRSDRYYLESDWKGNLEKDGGTLFTQYSHFLDIMGWLFGDIQNAQGRFFDYNHQGITDFEDSGTVTFDFIKGGNGVLNFSTSVWHQNMESSLTIIAENGAVKIAGQYMERLEYCHVKNYECPVIAESPRSNDYGYYRGSAGNHGQVIENVVETLNGQTEVSVPLSEGVALVGMIERMYKDRKDLLEQKREESQNRITREIV